MTAAAKPEAATTIASAPRSFEIAMAITASQARQITHAAVHRPGCQATFSREVRRSPGLVRCVLVLGHGSPIALPGAECVESAQADPHTPPTQDKGLI